MIGRPRAEAARSRTAVGRLRAVLGSPDQMLRSAASFVAALYVAGIVLLGTWLAIIVFATGWRPIVITGGSMQPALRVGDVILVDDHPSGLLGQRSVITYQPVRGAGLVTHRIHEVLPESQTYVTKGDANPRADTDPVSPAQIVGVGRLVIPVLGLPVVWLQSGNFTALGALGVMSVAALVVLVTSAVREAMAGRNVVGRSSEMASRGIRRVRLLAGLMILGGLYYGGSGIGSGLAQSWRTELVVGSFAVLMVVNLVSVLASRRHGHDPPKWLVVIELGADTLLAGGLIALTGESGVAWAFIALPIVEAAVRYRLAGALLHWVLMTMLTSGARLFILDRAGAPLFEIIAELERLLDQLGILLLLVMPGAYLTEQLVTDVLRQDQATTMAVERARLLERVAETGYELNRLGNELFATLIAAVTGLGFDQGDVHLRLPNGTWKALSSSYPDNDRVLPRPGDPGSGLRLQDLAMNEVIIDADDPEPTEIQSLRSHDLEVLARLTVSTEEGRHVVVRAATTTGSGLQAGSIDALRLLAGQAAVAMQNDQLVSELQGVQVELAKQALHDALTGLPNRAQFMTQLHDGLASAVDPGRRHVVMFMDLNGFKAVNDTLGHEAGDALLIAVAERLTTAVGKAGLVARLGGDEFTVLLEPVESIDSAMAVVERIHDELSEPFDLSGTPAEVGGSIGVAMAEIGLGGTEILRRADVAMYAAKSSKAARRTALYEPELDGQDQRRGRMTAEFIKALESGGLHLVYQPLVATDGQLRGVEALLRWTHPEMGRISTATVLELAEGANRVEELTEFVFRTAIGDVTSCRVPAEYGFTLAVNVTPTELVSERLIRIVRQALSDYRWPADRLVIELNERIVADGKASLANVSRVVEMGVGLALDDFGEGRTSLAHLRGLPINQLKLDRGLVQQSVTSDADRIILKSVIDLAHDLQYEVVAEGVETPEQLQATLDAGTDLLQGFGLYRPMKLASLRYLLREQGMFSPLEEERKAADRLPPRLGPVLSPLTRRRPVPAPVPEPRPAAPLVPELRPVPGSRPLPTRRRRSSALEAPVPAMLASTAPDPAPADPAPAPDPAPADPVPADPAPADPAPVPGPAPVPAGPPMPPVRYALASSPNPPTDEGVEPWPDR